MTAKTLVLLAGWLVAMLPPLSAILLWKSYGGSVYPPELATLTFGHVLDGGLTIGLAAAMSSFTEHPSTAAILTLSVTVGTWIVNFFGAIQGGWWERAAAYTPAAMVAEFQHGLLRLDTTLVALVLILAGLGLAAIWMRLGVGVSRRACESAGIGVLAAAGIFACTFAHSKLGYIGSPKQLVPRVRRTGSPADPRAPAHRGASCAGGSAADRSRASRAFEAAAHHAEARGASTYRARRSGFSNRHAPATARFGMTWADAGR